ARAARRPGRLEAGHPLLRPRWAEGPLDDRRVAVPPGEADPQGRILERLLAAAGSRRRGREVRRVAGMPEAGRSAFAAGEDDHDPVPGLEPRLEIPHLDGNAGTAGLKNRVRLAAGEEDAGPLVLRIAPAPV